MARAGLDANTGQKATHKRRLVGNQSSHLVKPFKYAADVKHQRSNVLADAVHVFQLHALHLCPQVLGDPAEAMTAGSTLEPAEANRVAQYLCYPASCSICTTR